MKTNQVNLRRRSFAGVGRIPEIHKKTTSTGATFRDRRLDGQQRITTVSILLCSIRDYLKENYAEEAKDRINTIDNALWLVDRDGEKKGIRITLGNLDHESYKNLIKSNLAEIENENLREAYDYFYSKLEDLGSIDEIKKFHDILLDQLIYVSITAEGHKDAYHLFEAMNNRGLSLSPIDLMKNYLLMKASEREDVDRSQESKIEQLWGDIIKNLDSLDTRNPAITFFRQYFMSSPLLGITEKITKNKLYDPHFTNTIDKRKNLEKLLLDIRKQSTLYKKMLTQSIDRFNRSENAEINRLLLNAKTVSITSFTLFLRAFRQLNEVEKIKSIIRKSNALLLRRQICEKYTGAHDTIFNHLAQVAFKKNDPLDYMDRYLAEEERFPPDQQFNSSYPP